MRAVAGREAAAAQPGASLASPCSTSYRPAMISARAERTICNASSEHGRQPLLSAPPHNAFLVAMSPHRRYCSFSPPFLQTYAQLATASSSHEGPRQGARDGVSASSAAGRRTPAPAGPSAADLAAASLLTDEALRSLGVQLPSHCCGCGMRLQRQDATAPGFFLIPTRLLEPREEGRSAKGGDAEDDDEDGELRALEAARSEMDADAQADMEDVGGLGSEEPDVLCQRCFSLKHSGKVKVQAMEASMPVFDLGKKVGRKIYLQKDRKAVVLCVVDVWDFDGSLPRLALRSLFPPGTGEDAPEELPFQLMVAVNKFDLLPSAATPIRVQQWVRLRLKQAGLPSPDKVFMVSAANGMGVKDMVQDIRQALGFRGDLWVVGAQNAGKSSLINAMKRLAGTAGKGEPTVAPVPGTTLGLLQVPGMPLGPKHRAFDTPGVPHPHQLTTQLGLEEVKKVLPSKQLRGRTYRLAAGNTLLLGAGLARLDVVVAPGPTLYLTVFVSHHVNLHLGKTEGAEERLPRLIEGGLLSPPDSPKRRDELAPLEPVEVAVEGTDWRRSTVDVAVAGLGWVSVGCAGRAVFRLWTLPGVSVTTHAALIPDYAETFERPGVSTLLPKAQTRAHQAQRQQREERAERREKEGGEGGRVVAVGSKGPGQAQGRGQGKERARGGGRGGAGR